MSSNETSLPDAPAPPPAIRVTFAYDEHGVHVIDRTPVLKRVPTGGAEQAGGALPPHALVAELRDGADATVHRQVVEHALPESTEVFDQNAERGVYRLPLPQSRGVFTVLVPDDAAAESVVLLAGPGTRAAGMAAQTPPPGGSAEILRAPLRGDGNG